MVSSTKIKLKSPLVSVIMPAYNAESYIDKAISSILGQTFADFELIIIDDNSSDKTASIIEKYKKKDRRIVVLHNTTNLKMAKALNSGIKIARGKYIARMDSDDWSFPYRLEKQVLFIQKHLKVGILGGSMEIIDKEGKKIGRRDYALSNKEIRRKLFRYSPFCHPLIMIRKTFLDKVGYYDPIYNPAEDYDLYFRVGEVSEFANLPDVLIKYRIVDNSMTTGSTKKMELQTIAIRNKYKLNHGYSMTFLDNLFTRLHWFSIYFIPIPSSVKIKAFNLLRNSRF
jgi:glycosyltransferase involved in cell wall biosynthesis